MLGTIGWAHSRKWLLVAWMCGALCLCGCSLPASPDAPRPQPNAPTPATQSEPAPAPPETGAPPDLLSANGAEFERISLDEGLSQSVVTAITQDSQGFVWLGTQDGLNRYDGARFLAYRHESADPSSISDNFVQAVREDDSGFLWIGTHGGGLNRFDPRSQQFTTYRHDPDDPGTISHNNVLALAGSRDGTLWVGTAAGINRFDPATGQVTRYPHGDPADSRSTSGSIAQTILEDRQGGVWIGTFDGGLNFLDPETGSIRVYRKDEGNSGSLPDDNVQALLEDRAGALWVGTAAGGLAHLERDTGRFVRYQHDPGDPTSVASNDVNALFEDRWGRLWVGTENGGLDRFDPDSGAFIHHPPRPDDPRALSNPTVQSLYQDRGGVLWVGTFGGGANKYDPYARKFVLYRNDPDDAASLSSNLVWSFAEARDGSIWIGTLDGGLNRLDPSTGEFTRFRNSPSNPASLSSDQVWSVFADRSGDLWAGTAAGLDRLDAEEGSFAHIAAPPVFEMAEDDSGSLWLATGGGGLGRLDRDTGEIAYFRHSPDDPAGLGADFLTSLLIDRDGRLWIGTFDGGLNRLDDLSADPESAKFVTHRNDPDDPASLVHDTVLDLHQDPSGTLWVGTDRGLDRMDAETGTFAHFGVKEGLANEVIYAIREDDAGNLWLSTNRGLSRFNPQSGAIRNYTPGDGLQSNEFNQGAALRASDGTMYFGGINGFNAFDPAEVRDHHYAPPVVLTGFDLFNKPAPIGGDSPLKQAIDRTSQISLSHAQDFFAFEFASLDYASPDLNQYAYMMEGLDKDWNYASSERRYASYTNVPPGEYTFRVRGTNSDGIWSDAEAALGLIVTPPLWQTWWFRAAVALALMSGIVATYRLRLRSVEARSRELEAQVAKRTEEIQRRQQELAALYRADEELYSHLSVDRVLAALTGIAVHILSADRSAVITWDEARERPIVRAAQGFSPDEIERLSQPGAASPAELVGRTGHPVVISDAETNPQFPAVEGVRASMHLPIVIDDEVYGVFCVGYEAPHAFSPDEQRLFAALSHRTAIAIENARHFDQEHRRAEQLHLINEVGQRMNAVLAPDDLLQQLTALIREAFDCNNVAIGFIEGDEVVAQVECGIPNKVYEGLRAPVGEDGLWGWVAQNREPLLVNDLRGEGLFPRAAGAAPGFPSQICVPLTSKDEAIGVLSIAGERPNQFDDEDLMVLQALANQAATAIENARLYEQGQQMAVSEERSRLARELHDAVTQTLFSASLIAEALPAIWEADRQEGDELLEQMRKLSRSALAEMRTLLLELRPAALADAALPDLMRQLADGASGRIGAPVEVFVEGACGLPEQVRVTLYRIAQEALNNVAKHARASRVCLKLSCRPLSGDEQRMAADLEVCDDGCGFDPESVSPEHLGLGIIRERADAIGAESQIISAPGRGTVVCVHWREELAVRPR